MLELKRAGFIAITLFTLLSGSSRADSSEPRTSLVSSVEVPFLAGDPCVIAVKPDVGKYATKKQEPVDFSVWQAADGSWQVWSCIRGTNCGGRSRLLHGWEGPSLSSPGWTAKGIAMEAKPELGEQPGGLQAPYTFKYQGKYYMLYGDWFNICLQTSEDGKTFKRVLNADGKSLQFTEGETVHARDPMAIEIDGVWYVYYTGNPDRKGKIYCRTTKDFKNWSGPTIVASGGISGDGRTAAECPQVVKHDGKYYLFRTQIYGKDAKTHVYVSTDPLQFGIDNDKDYYVTTLPIAAPEYVLHEGKEYVVSLNPTLDGIRTHRLGWAPASRSPVQEN